MVEEECEASENRRRWLKKEKKMSVWVFVCEGKKKVFYSASQISIFNQIQKNKVYENGNIIIEQVKHE